MIIAVKCPSCNANLQIPDDVEFVTCEFCRTSIKVRDVIRVETDYDVPEWLKIAENAYKGENYDEAYEYYNIVLEKESFRYDAWIGKGLSAGWQSSDYEPRLDEMMQLISYGISKCDPKQVESQKDYLKKEILPILQNFYSQVKDANFSERSGFEEFIKRYTPLIKSCEKVYKTYYTNDISFIRFYAEALKVICDSYKIDETNTKVSFIQIPEPKKSEYLNTLRSLENEIKLSDKSYRTFYEIQRNAKLKKIFKGVFMLAIALIIFGGFAYILSNIGKTPKAEKEKEAQKENTLEKEYTIYSDFVKNNNIYYSVYASSQSLDKLKDYGAEIIAKNDSRTANTYIYFFNSKDAASKFSNKQIILKKNQRDMSANFIASVKFNTENEFREIYYYEKGKLKSEKY